MKKLVTHNGSFHTDDIFATAILSLYLEKIGEPFEVIRTRDELLLKEADFVYDVGGVYDPKINRFDHHQKGGAGQHKNGIEYAACGLVWETYGKELCSNSEVFDIIERRLICPIDASDNAIELVEVKGEVKPYYIQNLFRSFFPNITDTSDETLYKAFMESVEIAKKVLSNEIRLAQELVEGKEAVQNVYNASLDKRVLVFDKRCAWEEAALAYPEVLFVVMPKIARDMWGINAVPKSKNTFENRKNLPESWAALRDKDLADKTGVPDAVFCHRGLFMAVTKSKEGAVKLAQIAIES